MRIKHIIIFSILFSLPVQGFAAPVSLKKNRIAKVDTDSGKILCAAFTKKQWKAAQKVGKKYEVKESASDADKAACAQLLKVGAAKSLSQFPSASTLIKASSNSSSLVNSNTVSGTPPTLAELVDQGGDGFYWRAGVLSTIASGTPDEDTCNELFGSSTDGHSSGWGGCNLTQSVGYSVGEIARGGTSLCYMKNAGSVEGANSGAIVITSGSVPGGVKNLFSTPSGSSPRLIKVNAGGEEGGSTMYIQVYSSSQNESAGNQYKFDFWACEGDDTPQEFESTRITAGGQFISQSIHTFEGGSGIGQGTITGYLSRDGSDLVFDPSRNRTAIFIGLPGQGGSFKSNITINGENQVFSKVFEDTQTTRKGYSVARFDGSGLTSLRFYEGAFKEEHAFGSYTGGLEFRDTVYLAAPGSEYVALLDAVDFSTDSFYTDEASTPTIPTRARCDADADVEVSMNMNSDFMQEIAAECEGERIDGEIQICSTENVSEAMNQYNTACSE